MSDVPPDQTAPEEPPVETPDVPSPDVTLNVGDPNVHAHGWKSVGVDEQGLNELACDCGETGVGLGTFETGVV